MRQCKLCGKPASQWVVFGMDLGNFCNSCYKSQNKKMMELPLVSELQGKNAPIGDKYRVTSNTGWQTQAEIDINFPEGYYGEIIWNIRNVYGEYIKNENGPIRFDNEIDARTYCDKINTCSDGGVCCNFI